MTIALAQPFLEALDRYRRDERLGESVLAAIERLSSDPRHPGLNLEKIGQQKKFGIYSIRVTQQYRIILASQRQSDFTLIWLDNHDESYDWASRVRGLGRIVSDATGLDARWHATLPLPLMPRRDKEQTVVVPDIGALRQMLDGGLDRYIAYLDEQQRSYATFDHTTRRGLMFISGGAGTGKTAVAVHRVIHLAARPEIGFAGVQYLCYNRILSRTIRRIVDAQLSSRAKSDVNVTTFHGWAGRYLRSRDAHPAADAVKDDWLSTAVPHALRNNREAARILGDVTPNDIVKEIRLVIRPNGLSKAEDYIRFSRDGLATSISVERREAIWDLYRATGPESTGIFERDDLLALALELLEDDRTFVPYRGVVVDEAQDCGRVMVRLAKLMVGGDQRRLMALADPAQQIYENGYRWARREFAPRGAQSVILRKPYRCTKQIQRLASSLYREGDHAQDVAALHEADRDGPQPELWITSTDAERDEAFVRTLRDDLADGERQLQPWQIGILCGTHRGADDVAALLRRAGIAAERVAHEGFVRDSAAIAVMTIHSAKGLDFPSVFVLDFQSRASAGETTDESRALLYVAITRSSYSLRIMADRRRLDPLLLELDRECYEAKGRAAGLVS